MYFNCFRYMQNVAIQKKFLLRKNSLYSIFKNYSYFNIYNKDVLNVKDKQVYHHSFKHFSNKNKQNYEKFIFQLKSEEKKKKDAIYYFAIVVLLSLSLTYAAVPIYRIYCQAYGKGGKPKVSQEFLNDKIKNLKKSKNRKLKITFTANSDYKMNLNFEPIQSEIKLYPGETALAFYTAKNPLDKPINGISTYSVIPFEAGQYLHKIQCFCFEEQRLDPGEEIDMPIFFYIDPEYLEDPRLENVDELVLSYTFFEAKDGYKFLDFKK